MSDVKITYLDVAQVLWNELNEDAADNPAGVEFEMGDLIIGVEARNLEEAEDEEFDRRFYIRFGMLYDETDDISEAGVKLSSLLYEQLT